MRISKRQRHKSDMSRTTGSRLVNCHGGTIGYMWWVTCGRLQVSSFYVIFGWVIPNCPHCSSKWAYTHRILLYFIVVVRSTQNYILSFPLSLIRIPMDLTHKTHNTSYVNRNCTRTAPKWWLPPNPSSSTLLGHCVSYCELCYSRYQLLKRDDA